MMPDVHSGYFSYLRSRWAAGTGFPSWRSAVRADSLPGLADRDGYKQAGEERAAKKAAACQIHISPALCFAMATLNLAKTVLLLHGRKAPLGLEFI